MKNLVKAYEDFKRLKFPHSPANEQLNEIFTDLVQYDSQIAGSVDKLIKKKSLKPTDLYFDSELEKRLHRFISEAKSDGDIESAKYYLEYLDHLKNLIKVAETKTH